MSWFGRGTTLVVAGLMVSWVAACGADDTGVRGQASGDAVGETGQSDARIFDAGGDGATDATDADTRPDVCRDADCGPPQKCGAASDCDAPKVCSINRSRGMATCRPPGAGSGKLGDGCTTDQGCAANLCHHGRFRDTCTVPCTDDSDCSRPGYECATASIDGGSGQTANIDICVAKDPPSCQSNDDCAAGLTCAIVPDTADNALESVCIPSGGGKTTGVPCTSDAACASLVCLAGTCSAPCEPPHGGQCAADQLCRSSQVAKHGLSDAFNMCETLADDRCDVDGICADGVRMCNELRVAPGGTGRRAFCGMPDPSAPGGLAAPCTNSEGCRSRVCLAGASDECSVICAADNQCEPGQLCTTLVVDTTQLGYCISGCSDNDDCAGMDFTDADNKTVEHICTTNENTRADTVDKICARRVTVDPSDPTRGLLGDTCQTDSDCQNDMCLTNTVFDGTACTKDSDCQAGQVCQTPAGQATKECAEEKQFCTRLCDENADCSGGIGGNRLTVCDSTISVTLSSGTTDIIAACAPGQP